MITTATPDKVTKRWMRDASDELAVFNGCWFDEEQGQFVVDWLYRNLRLYEGSYAGQPFECRDWQYEATMRMFGWMRENQDPVIQKPVIRRITHGSFWIAKKNKKSPTLAAWMIYMFCGDGEMGQKCFPTAKNGKQIKQNVVRHVHEMIKQSPLAGKCKINLQDGSVYHKPTASLILPLSSENIQTQEANEGLNGSSFVDEVHVVDKSHINRISRAGISRDEPLHVEASTVGKNPESYGMGRFKYAEGVISGDKKDDRTLAMIYAAPQKASPEEIHKDPLRFGRMANPAFGHTVKESEFLHDYNTSKDTVAGFAEWCMYRLNIWQHAVNPWLSIHDWDSCPSTDEPLDVALPTFGGLDLSRTTDFTAWVKYQPGEVPRCSGHYWCPRQRAIELSHQFEIPVLDWEQQGWVTLNDDRVIDREDIYQYLVLQRRVKATYIVSEFSKRCRFSVIS